MKQHLSVFAFFARSSIYKILLILFVMVLLQGGMFLFRFHEAEEIYNAGIGIQTDELQDEFGDTSAVGNQMTNIETLITRSFIPQIFGVSFLLVTILLCLPGTEYSAQSGYTLQRLSIHERQIFFHQAAYNTIAYLMLSAVQIGLNFAMCLFYTANAPIESVGAQTIFLAFYRSDFLHSLLPLDEAALWIRNFIGLITLGITAAAFPYKQRRRNFGGSILSFAIFNLVFFITSIGEGKAIAIYIIMAVCLLCEVTYTLFFKEEVDAL